MRFNVLRNSICARMLAATLGIVSMSVSAQFSGLVELEAPVVFPTSLYSSTVGLRAVSGDGNVFAITEYASRLNHPRAGGGVFSTPQAYLLTESGSRIALRALDGTLVGASANAISANGNTVVGSSFFGPLRTVSPPGGAFGFTAVDRHAVRWNETGAATDLGVLTGGRNSGATAVNGDGSVIVGNADDGTVLERFPEPVYATRAFRWTQASGMLSLGLLNGGREAFANGVSRDGSVVVGTAYDGQAGNSQRAFLWTQAAGMLSLGTLNGGVASWGEAVSGNGHVVVGYASEPNSSLRRAFRWNSAQGMVSLGTLTPGSESFAWAVNADGSVVVGQSGTFSGNSSAFRWTATTGMQSVENWLRAHGVIVPVDITHSAVGVSDDGNVVVGSLAEKSVADPNGGRLLQVANAFIARVSPLGSGIITTQDLQSSLSSATSAIQQVTSLGNTVLHGAHSRPLSRRVAAGKSCVWISGDAGRDDHGARDGAFGLAEVGGCHRFAPEVQASLSLGVSGSRQDLVFDGKNDVRTRFGVAELLAKIPGTNLWPSAALLFQQGHADVKRGYLNAGVLDASRGRPDVRTTAARVRMDWDGALRSGDVSLSPYADMSYARTRIDSYTEGGGGFPAQFDARTEKMTEARLGADANYRLSSELNLLGRLEGVHRFEKSGVNTSGTVLGLASFDFPGARHKRDWLRAGVGVDVKLGPGTLSAMLNATTQGATPSYWLNASYQVAF